MACVRGSKGSRPREHGALDARSLNIFLKNADAVIGPGDTIVLPAHTEPWNLHALRRWAAEYRLH